MPPYRLDVSFTLEATHASVKHASRYLGSLKDMSAKLEKALASKQVLIRKLASGEVCVHFESKDIKDIIISHKGVVDLLSKRGVTVDAIRNSNLKDLIRDNLIEVI